MSCHTPAPREVCRRCQTENVSCNNHCRYAFMYDESASIEERKARIKSWLDGGEEIARKIPDELK